MANDAGFGTGLVLGGAIGLLAGLLLAPKAGEQTRAEVMERTAGLRQRADDMTADFRERVREIVREVMDEGRVVANRIHPRRDNEGELAAEPDPERREEPPA